MPTTFEAKAAGTYGKQARNYSSFPNKDVEILVDQPRLCTSPNCGEPMVYDPNIRYGGGWVHESSGDVRTATCTWGNVGSKCSYCGTTDQAEVTFRQHAWHDATECSRCGGESGYAIGD